MKEAEEMYLRASTGKKKAGLVQHQWTLSTVNSLGLLYSYQSKIEEAENMYLRALAGCENSINPTHTCLGYASRNKAGATD